MLTTKDTILHILSRSNSKKTGSPAEASLPPHTLIASTIFSEKKHSTKSKTALTVMQQEDQTVHTAVSVSTTIGSETKIPLLMKQGFL